MFSILRARDMRQCCVAATLLCPSLPPQDFRNDEQKVRADAKAWQLEHHDHKAGPSGGAGPGAAAAGGDDGTGAAAKPSDKAPRAKRLPKKLDVDVAKTMLPPAKGVSLWFETKTGRLRVRYVRKGVGETTSADVDKVGLKDSISCCLIWAWAAHVDCGGDPSPWKELRS